MTQTGENPLDLYHERLGLATHFVHDDSFIVRPGVTPCRQDRLDAFIAQIKKRAPRQSLPRSSVKECDEFVKDITKSLEVALRQFLKWLGKASEGSELAVRLLEQIVSCLQFTFGNPSFDDVERLCLPAADLKQWECLCELLTRKWFTRVWIIQEAVLSGTDSTWFACGETFIPWQTLLDAIYNACGRFGLIERRGEPMAEIHGGLLAAPGVFFDTTVEVTDFFTNPDLILQSPKTENIALRTAVDFCSQINHRTNKTVDFDDLWNTLVGDETTGKSPSLPGQTYSTRQRLLVPITYTLRKVGSESSESSESSEDRGSLVVPLSC
ncbi:unnamed protein product [Fusarium venenatum]|uniref:Heterokaryon incompatibility domain-containing protein n=1 Tax=Fusarium venenatum TaxID=56646 RepID=A0A2L2T1W8_9HYPO|nr:uncharacterized protein FVRRES_00100 [Fusarium venenatum]CEI63588.1 unnamed protein product [Fusarium venenatum]